MRYVDTLGSYNQISKLRRKFDTDSTHFKASTEEKYLITMLCDQELLRRKIILSQMHKLEKLGIDYQHILRDLR